MELFNKAIDQLKSWIRQSNRKKHLWGGGITFIVAGILFWTLTVSFPTTIYSAFITTCFVAVALEFKDDLYGSKFDILDILATIVIPAVMAILTYLIKLVC